MNCKTTIQVISFILVSIFTSCKIDDNSIDKTNLTLSQVSDSLILSVTQELGSDFYEGRRPFTQGEDRTVDYLEKTLYSMGLTPAYNDSYLQEVSLVEITGTPSEKMSFIRKDKSWDLQYGDDFVLHTEGNEADINIENSPLVFCGYGIVDPSRDWNDFKGIDLKGKTAVVLVNDPGFGSEDSTFFNGDIMTYFGRWTYKYEEADRQGADALLIIHETNMAAYPWYVVKSSWAGAQLGIKRTADQADCKGKGWISLNRARELFANANLDFTEELKKARSKDFTPVDLKTSMSVGLKSVYKEDVTNNVIAYIKGEKYPEEHVLYTAHWDHLGISNPVEGDSIYNGALDNASGVAELIAIAKAFSEMETKPDRSVVFAFVTAEEQGLLGSAYYAEHPFLPLNKAVVNLNIDGVNLHGAANDLTITGMGYSDMDSLATEFSERQGRYVQNEQEPEKGYFFRSDHFNFVKKGVPALYATGGYDLKVGGKEKAKEMHDLFISSHYHQPSDEYDSKVWKGEGIKQDAQLYFDIGWQLANQKEWPKWNKNSPFQRSN